MITRSLTLCNFKSFYGEHVIDFTKHNPGLFYMGGDNKVEPDLGSNGSGKSSVWEAWHWVRYGKTPRALRAGNVKTWGVKGVCRVVETLEHEGTVYEIERCQGPNSLKITEAGVARTVDQDELTQLLRVNSTEFAHSLFLGQGTPLFFDLTAGAQTEIFESVLDLSVWDNLAKTAGELARALDREDVVRIDTEVARLKGRQEVIQQRLIQLQEEFSVEELDQRIKAHTKEQKQLEVAIAAGIANAEKASKTHVKLKDELVSLQQKESAQSKVYGEATSELTARKREVATLERQVGELDLLGAECPTCLQLINRGHRSRCKKELYSFIAIASAVVSDATHKVESALQELKQIQSQVAKQKAEESRAASTVDQFLVKVEQQERQLLQIQQSLQSAKTEGSRIKNEKSSLEQQQKEIVDQLQAQEVERVELMKQIDAAQYWVKGFRHVRLLSIEKALTSLEIEVNMALEQLGLIGWRVEFEIERETASKTISKGLHVNFYPAGSDKATPWESWSGGESQRLRLAGRIGVANMILQYRGVRPSLEVWDEPAQYLSQEGIDDLVDCLRQRAEDLGIQIWLVDHRSYDLGGFAGSVQIEKTEKGSCFVI